MKKLVPAVFLTSIALLATTLVGQDKPAANNAKQPPAAQQPQQGNPNAGQPHMAYLGVYVDSLHPSFQSHFGNDTLSKHQGLVVEDVQQGSAAEKGGIKEHDILLSYDDQKLFVPEQLARLVHADKAGREVSLALLRDGKQQKVQVKLGEMPAMRQNYQSGYGNAPGGFPGGPNQNYPDHQFANGQYDPNDSAFEYFDSMSLKMMKDNRMHAEVSYLDKDGKARKHTFEGTEPEIQRAIQNEKDMRPAEKMHLLNALGLADEFQQGQFNASPYGNPNQPQQPQQQSAQPQQKGAGS